MWNSMGLIRFYSRFEPNRFDTIRFWLYLCPVSIGQWVYFAFSLSSMLLPPPRSLPALLTSPSLSLTIYAAEKSSYMHSTAIIISQKERSSVSSRMPSIEFEPTAAPALFVWLAFFSLLLLPFSFLVRVCSALLSVLSLIIIVYVLFITKIMQLHCTERCSNVYNHVRAFRLGHLLSFLRHYFFIH